MSKFEPLTTYLKSTKENVIRLSLDDIEEIIQCKLSESARTYRAMWANSSSHMSQFWISIGWQVNRVHLGEGPYIEFIRRADMESKPVYPKVASVVPVQVPELIKSLHELYSLGIIDATIYDEKKRVLLDKIR